MMSQVSTFRRRGLSRIRAAARRGSAVQMFLREAGRFSSEFVAFVPTSIVGAGATLTISGVTSFGRRRNVTVNGPTINWQSVVANTD